MTTAVLVTGGLGFIGAHTTQALLRAGRRVFVIDRLQAGNADELVLTPDERAEVRVLASDVPSPETLAGLLEEHDIEQVVHLASPLATVTEAEPSTAVTDMVMPHHAILEAALRANIRRVVWASSVGVFGRTDDYPTRPIGNDAAHYPLTLYGATKSYLERVSARYADACGLDTIGLRFPMVYGPGRQRGGGQFATRLIEGAALGSPIVAENADARYDWLYATDAARSVCLALDAEPTPVRALTICGGVATVRDVADLLAGWFPDLERRDEPGITELVADYDPEAARAAIGYAPRVGLREGVLATVNAARARAGLPPVV
jgi:UDP-glucose 4-epimerase